jgi:hypothetical protein
MQKNNLTLNFVLLLAMMLVTTQACAMGGKRPNWTSNEEMKQQDLFYWPCSPDELPAGSRLKGMYCSPFCPKSRPDGSCAEAKKMRILDSMSDADWEFIRNNDMTLAPSKSVF